MANSVWVVTDVNGGEPGGFLGLFEKDSAALASISFSHHNEHVKIHKVWKAGWWEVTVEVFQPLPSGGLALDRTELYKVEQKPIYNQTEHL